MIVSLRMTSNYKDDLLATFECLVFFISLSLNSESSIIITVIMFTFQSEGLV